MQTSGLGLFWLAGVLPCVDTRIVAAVLRIEGQHVDGRRRKHHEVPVLLVQLLENVLQDTVWDSPTD